MDVHAGKLKLKKQVVIVSHRGFVGSTLYRRLQSQSDLTVVGLDSDSCNLLDPVSTATAFDGIAGPFTLVFLSTFGRFPRDDYYVYSRNVTMAQNLICALKQKDVENLIFTSSVCMYGRPPAVLPVTEDIPVVPTGHYGLSKYCSELLLKFNMTCPVAILRIPGTYGNADRGKSVISSFVQKIGSVRDSV